MIKKLPIGVFALCFSGATFAQSLADIKSPKVLPPSPEAAALGKYAQIPVDKSTGIPAIGLPLYTIKTPRFSLPVSLSYHASGIKVDEVATWVGAGWSLNSGGVITRNIIGTPDEVGGFLTNNVKKAVDIQFPRDSAYMQEVAKGNLDSQPDNFFYNFNDQTGAFVFGEDKKPVLIPYKPVKISYKGQDGFEIVDDSGNIYNFNNTEYVGSSASTKLSGISSWYLTQMVSADHTDTIKFNYKTDPNYQAEFSYSFNQGVGPAYSPNDDHLGAERLYPLEKNVITRNYSPITISSIIFKGGKVEFFTSSGRLDNANLALDHISVSSYNNDSGQYTQIKRFNLLTDYFNSNADNPQWVGTSEKSKHRLKLVGVDECDRNNAVIKSHRFEYNQTALPPVNNFAQDKWGYFNGKTQNQTLLESQQYNSGNAVYAIGGNEGADRSVSPSDMQAGVLQKIIYPTGGYTVFEYECNKQFGTNLVSQTTQASSVGYYQERNTATFTPSSAAPQTSSYVFHVKFRRTGDIPFNLPETPYVQVIQVSTGNILYTSSASQNNDIDIQVTVPLRTNESYQLVAVSRGGSNSVNTSYLPYSTIGTTYQVPSGVNLNNIGGLRVSSVKNYDKNGSALLIETYKYGGSESGGGELLSASLMVDNIERITYFGLPGGNGPSCAGCATMTASGSVRTFNSSSIYSLSSLSGSPVGYPEVAVYNGDATQNNGKSIYRYTISGDSILLTPPNYMQGIKPVPVTWKNGDPIYEAHYRNTGNNQYALVQEKTFDYYNFARTAARGLLVGYTFETVNFTPQASWPYWPQSNFYWFDYPISSGSRQIKKSKTVDYAPDGVTHQTENTTDFYYDNLNHVQPTRIVNSASKGGDILSKVNYPEDMVIAGNDPTSIYSAMVGANMVVPQVEVVKSKGSVQTEKSKTNYSFFNNSRFIEPQSVEIQNGTNASETRLIYNSYDNRGNIQTVTKASSPSTSYLWGYNSQYPIAKIENATYQDVVNVIGQGVVDQLANNTPSDPAQVTALLSPLRTDSRLKNALVSTYTYNPIVGITSQTDPKGMTTTYEYDSFQRLLNVKDQNSNIIKHNDYHYQNQ